MVMEASDKARILCRLHFLATNTISLDRLRTLLASSGALTPDEMQEMLSRTSDYKRCSFLYENILLKEPKTFEILIRCLRKSGNDRIADTLAEDLTTEEAESYKHILEEELDKNSNISWCWSGFIGEDMFPVRILSKDASRGLVTAYHRGDLRVTSWLYPLGLIFNRDGIRNLPKRLHLSGLWVHDKVYQYELNGLTRVPTMDSGFKVLSKQSTRKTCKEFEDWVDSQERIFKSEDYDIVNNNSLKFTKAACDFLQIQYPPELQKMEEFVLKNPRSVRFFSFKSVPGNSIDKVKDEDKIVPRRYTLT